MDRLVLLLQAEDLALDAFIKGSPFAVDLPPALVLQCAQRMLNVIDSYDLETPESVIEAVKRGMRKSFQGGGLSARKEAQILALYRAIGAAPKDASSFADFVLTWTCSSVRDW